MRQRAGHAACHEKYAGVAAEQVIETTDRPCWHTCVRTLHSLIPTCACHETQLELIVSFVTGDRTPQLVA